MQQLNMQKYYLAVYLIGWVVVAIGIYMAMKAGLTRSGSEDAGLGVIFGGMYMTAFVKNAELKAKIIELEQDR